LYFQFFDVHISQWFTADYEGSLYSAVSCYMLRKVCKEGWHGKV